MANIEIPGTGYAPQVQPVQYMPIQKDISGQAALGNAQRRFTNSLFKTAEMGVAIHNHIYEVNRVKQFNEAQESFKRKLNEFRLNVERNVDIIDPDTGQPNYEKLPDAFNSFKDEAYREIRESIKNPGAQEDFDSWSSDVLLDEEYKVSMTALQKTNETAKDQYGEFLTQAVLEGDKDRVVALANQYNQAGVISVVERDNALDAAFEQMAWGGARKYAIAIANEEGWDAALDWAGSSENLRYKTYDGREVYFNDEERSLLERDLQLQMRRDEALQKKQFEKTWKELDTELLKGVMNQTLTMSELVNDPRLDGDFNGLREKYWELLDRMSRSGAKEGGAGADSLEAEDPSVMAEWQKLYADPMVPPQTLVEFTRGAIGNGIPMSKGDQFIRDSHNKKVNPVLNDSFSLIEDTFDALLKGKTKTNDIVALKEKQYKVNQSFIEWVNEEQRSPEDVRSAAHNIVQRELGESFSRVLRKENILFKAREKRLRPEEEAVQVAWSGGFIGLEKDKNVMEMLNTLESGHRKMLSEHFGAEPEEAVRMDNGMSYFVFDGRRFAVTVDAESGEEKLVVYHSGIRQWIPVEQVEGLKPFGWEEKIAAEIKKSAGTEVMEEIEERLSEQAKYYSTRWAGKTEDQTPTAETKKTKEIEETLSDRANYYSTRWGR